VHLLTRIAAGAALLLVAAMATLHLAQRRLLYFPSRDNLAGSMRLARATGLEPWLDAAGRFVGWHAPLPGVAPLARVIVFHGNAGCALDRTYLRDVLQQPGQPAVELFLFEYPGYGPRPGSPGEAAIVAAAVEAIDLLGDQLPVYLVGESLGSAVAPGHYPFIPSFLVRDAFRADLALPSYGGRVAFLIAARDEVVFADLGRALFEAYPGPRRLWEEPRAFHNTLRFDPADPLWTEIWAFLRGAG
jgi:uncharacterized protein